MNESVYRDLQKTQTFVETSNRAAAQQLNATTRVIPEAPKEPQVTNAEACTQQLSGLKPKSYNEFTKKFDNNSLKLKLRAWRDL